ncbi:MAG: hypothetical protein AAFW81_09590 [Pseudomonadota bacterium]
MAHEEKTVKELQELALDAGRAPRPRRKRASRAAELDSIDMLSRWSAAGLALVAGAGIYLAVTIGRDFPIRAAVWTAMLLGALWVCRSLQARFRAGAAIAARPFRWRASFAACASVLGVAFASAPILLTPASADGAVLAEAMVLTLLGAFGAAAFFSAHFNSAAAMAIPGAAFPILAAARAGDTAAMALIGLAIGIGAAGLFMLHRTIEKAARRRHPRTTTLRSPVDVGDAPHATPNVQRQVG